MRIKGINFNDFTNYKVPSMFLVSCFCDFKCCHEQGKPNTMCQNAALESQPIQEFSDIVLIAAYIHERTPKAVVIGGMEPMKQLDEIISFIKSFREAGIADDVVIYTGYNKDEIPKELEQLKQFPNIVVKFGRYIPKQQPHFDEVLGVNLVSPNQYAERIS